MDNSRSEFDRVWPWLDASLASFGRTHSKEQVWKLIAEGRAELWPNEHCAIVGKVVRRPIGLREYVVWLQGGELAELLPMHPAIEHSARARNCDRMIAGGRDGWLRVLDGWEKMGSRRCKWLIEPPPHLRATK
jgi:hypothetical protein